MTGSCLLIPRSAVHQICRVLAGLLIAGCVLAGCAALAGCGPTEHQDRALALCVEAGGIPQLFLGDYAGCEFRSVCPSTCPPCPCETPAEAPEGGRP